MTLKGLMFAESLVAWWKLRATESLMSFVCCLMTAQSGRGKEALSTALPVANMVPLVCVSSLDVLLQVLFLQVCLGAAVVGADEWALIGMRSDMRLQPRRPIECLFASFVGALDRLLLRWKLCSPILGCCRAWL